MNIKETTWEAVELEWVDEKTWKVEKQKWFKVTEKWEWKEPLYFNLDKFIQNFFMMEVLMNETYEEVKLKEFKFKDREWLEVTEEHKKHREDFNEKLRLRMLWDLWMWEYLKMRDELIEVIKDKAPEWYKILDDNYDSFYETVKGFIDERREAKKEASQNMEEKDGEVVA